ncbi:MAG: response regulator [Cytophagaceae bacterium]|nr:response regulator [Cytophagaceae bacterium]
MSPYQYNCVLLVDDDGVTNFINHRLIKKLNLTDCIQSAINGNEALRYIKDFISKNDQNCPELILLDINMPVLDGFEFLDEFQKLNINNRDRVKIIMLTTSTHQKDVLKIAKDTKIGYINKPLTEEKLKECLNAPAQEARGMA